VYKFIIFVTGIWIVELRILLFYINKDPHT